MLKSPALKEEVTLFRDKVNKHAELILIILAPLLLVGFMFYAVWVYNEVNDLIKRHQLLDYDPKNPDIREQINNLVKENRILEENQDYINVITSMIDADWQNMAWAKVTSHAQGVTYKIPNYWTIRTYWHENNNAYESRLTAYYKDPKQLFPIEVKYISDLGAYMDGVYIETESPQYDLNPATLREYKTDLDHFVSYGYLANNTKEPLDQHTFLLSVSRGDNSQTHVKSIIKDKTHVFGQVFGHSFKTIDIPSNPQTIVKTNSIDNVMTISHPAYWIVIDHSDHTSNYKVVLANSQTNVNITKPNTNKNVSGVPSNSQPPVPCEQNKYLYESNLENTPIQSNLTSEFTGNNGVVYKRLYNSLTSTEFKKTWIYCAQNENDGVFYHWDKDGVSISIESYSQVTADKLLEIDNIVKTLVVNN